LQEVIKVGLTDDFKPIAFAKSDRQPIAWGRGRDYRSAALINYFLDQKQKVLILTFSSDKQPSSRLSQAPTNLLATLYRTLAARGSHFCAVCLHDKAKKEGSDQFGSLAIGKALDSICWLTSEHFPLE